MKDDALYVVHIIECIEKIESFVKDVDQNGFISSPLIHDATLRNLQLLAESTQRLSEEIRQRHPEVGWKKISGFRNVLVHGYLGIDLRKVWTIVSNEIPPLKQAVMKMHDELGISR